MNSVLRVEIRRSLARIGIDVNGIRNNGEISPVIRIACGYSSEEKIRTTVVCC